MNLSSFLQAAPNALIFKHAPLGISTKYLKFLGKIYYLANPSERNLIEKNIRALFQNHKDIEKIITKTFDGIFSHYSEKLIMAFKDLDILKKEIGSTISFSGVEHIEKALEKGGVMLVTGHFGAVEFLPLALYLQHLPVTMIVSFQTERLKESLIKKAMENNVELIDGKDGDIMHKAMGALRSGRILITECDEIDEWRPTNKTIEAFGGRINLDRTIDIMCKRSGATALGCFMVRNQKGYTMTIVPVEDEQTEEESIAAKLLINLEKFVMTFPDQWYQWKKFHKMRPEIA